jgi:7,8-dihydroneopterin aldolase/epimerase/oxygenase
MSAQTGGPDAIRIHGMRFWGKHGAAAAEREQDQPIDVDLEIRGDLTRAAASDALADTIDYSALYRACERVVTGQSCTLLEALAERIAQAVFDDSRIVALVVRVRKPRLLDGATPEVELRRHRPTS